MGETPAWLARHLELMLPAGDDPADRLGSFGPGDLVTLAGEQGIWRVTSTASLHRSFAGGLALYTGFITRSDRAVGVYRSFAGKLALYTGYVCIRVCDGERQAFPIYTGARKADP